MTKGELIAAVAKKVGLKNTAAAKTVEEVLNLIIKAVTKGNDVRLTDSEPFLL